MKPLFVSFVILLSTLLLILVLLYIINGDEKTESVDNSKGKCSSFKINSRQLKFEYFSGLEHNKVIE